MTGDVWKLPRPHDDYVAEVCRVVTGANPAAKLRFEHLRGLPLRSVVQLLEEPSVVTISGERGAGKTTVLAAACARLLAAGHFVLPPVRPEFFTHPRSVIGTAIAHMQTVLRSDYRDLLAGAAEDHPPIGAMLERALRRANLSTLVGGGDSHLRLDEQAADLALSAAADSDFMDDWSDVVAAVRTVVAQGSPGDEPLIVIPIDDPDLAPTVLKSVLLDLRLMTSVEGVVAIACLNTDETRAALKEEYLASFPRTADERLLSATVEAQLTKSLPPHRRVDVRGLSNEQKLEFRPLDHSAASLENLLTSVGAPSSGVPHTHLASVLRLPLQNSPSPYTASLSSNPRDLVGLHQRLTSVNALDVPAPAKQSLAAAEICTHAIAYGSRRSGAQIAKDSSGQPVFAVTEWTEPLVSCSLALEGIGFHGISASNLPRVEGIHPDLGRIDARVGHAQRTEASRDRGDAKGERLDGTLTHAILIVLECAAAGHINCSVSGSAPRRGGDRPSDYLRLSFDNEEADNHFLLVPAWDGYYDYFVLDEALDVLMTVSSETPQHCDYRVELQAYVVDHWREVLAVHRTRRGSEQIGAVTRAIQGLEDLADQQRVIAEAVDDLFDEIALEYDPASQPPVPVRTADFGTWLELLIPHALHPAIVYDAFREQVLERRATLVASRNRLDNANVRLASSLERRAKSSLDERWVGPLIAMLSEFDPEAGAILAASHRAALDNVQRARRRLLGESVVGASVSEPTPSSVSTGDPVNDFRVAMEALEEIERATQTMIDDQR